MMASSVNSSQASGCLSITFVYSPLLVDILAILTSLPTYHDRGQHGDVRLGLDSMHDSSAVFALVAVDALRCACGRRHGAVLSMLLLFIPLLVSVGSFVFGKAYSEMLIRSGGDAASRRRNPIDRVAHPHRRCRSDSFDHHSAMDQRPARRPTIRDPGILPPVRNRPWTRWKSGHPGRLSKRICHRVSTSHMKSRHSRNRKGRGAYFASHQSKKSHCTSSYIQTHSSLR